MIDRTHSLLNRWLPAYPEGSPWVDDRARQAPRHSEDDGLTASGMQTPLTREQVRKLIGWKWVANPARRRKSWRAVDADWDHASDCIARALAVADDIVAAMRSGENPAVYQTGGCSPAGGMEPSQGDLIIRLSRFEPRHKVVLRFINSMFVWLCEPTFRQLARSSIEADGCRSWLRLLFLRVPAGEPVL